MSFFKKSNPVGNVQIVPDSVPIPPIPIQSTQPEPKIPYSPLLNEINNKLDIILNLIRFASIADKKTPFDEVLEEPEQFKCKYCFKPFKEEKLMRRHIGMAHYDKLEI